MIDVVGLVDLEGDTGNDSLVANGAGVDSKIQMGSLLMQGWDGDDIIVANGTTVLGKATLWGGIGNDTFTLVDNVVGGNLYLDGWIGTDSLHDTGNMITGSKTVQRIETII